MRNTISEITFTGVDEKTDLTRIHPISLIAEIGILYTVTPDGRHRYPRFDWIAEALTELKKHEVKTALHVCGWLSRDQLEDGHLDPLIDLVGRVQINGIIKPSYLTMCCGRWPEKEIITQYNEKNKNLAGLGLKNHSLLVDSSGGRGISPEEWPEIPVTGMRVGFAGGLGPDNIEAELHKIERVAAGKRVWVDMEQKLRDEDDWFDLDKMFQCFFALCRYSRGNPQQL